MEEEWRCEMQISGHSCCAYQLTVPLVLCTRPAQDQASQNSSMNGEEALEISTFDRGVISS